MRVKDQLNRTLFFSSTPKRIISLVPSQTELLVDLGLKNQLVGITKFCVHPVALRQEVTVVGGTKQVYFDRIAALQPDIIICNKEENTEEIVNFASEIAPVWVSDIYTMEDSLEMIVALGAIFKQEMLASEICNTIKKEWMSFSEYMQNKPVKKTAYLIWKKPYMAAGQNTFINALLRLNRFDTIFTDPKERYPETSIAQLKAADLVLLSSEPFPFKQEDVMELKSALQKEVRLVDGEYFSWYGSRLRFAFQYFKTLHV